MQQSNFNSYSNNSNNNIIIKDQTKDLRESYLLFLVVVAQLKGVVEEYLSLPLVIVAINDAQIFLTQPTIGVILKKSFH
jgi:hypothetical protein